MYPAKLSLRLPEHEQIIRRDEELVAAAKAGSHAAFEEIEQCHSDRLYKRIVSITRNHEDAEDALQETFLRAFSRIKSFEGRSLLSTWLTRIAINCALMCLRRRRTRVEVPLQEQTESGQEIYSFDIRDMTPNPEEVCDLKQRRNGILNAIDRLDPKSRSAIGIWISTEYSMKEIANTLDVSLATVKARLHRARKRLARSSVREKFAGKRPLLHNQTFGLEQQRQETRNA